MFISWAKGLFASRAIWYLLGILVLLGTIWLYGNNQYRLGFDDAKKRYELRIAEERQRIEEANRKALEEAEVLIQDLNRTLEQRDATLRSIRRKAQEGPGADAESLSRDRVRQLNRID